MTRASSFRVVRFVFLLLPFALPPSGCARAVPESAAVQRLSVADRDNATPDIAARDRFVVVTWSAAIPDGGTDIFAAVSHDAGATFGAPVRVNDLAGEARANGEQPPRVAIGPQEIGVVWTSRRNGVTEVRLSKSPDAGRTFGASALVHPAGLTGARGWMSIASDTAGAMHVAWLDGRNAAPGPVASSAATTPAPAKSTAQGVPAAAGSAAHQHQHGDVRQDLYYAIVRPDGTQIEIQAATNVCFCCKTAVIVDPDGRTSLAWRNIYPGNLRDIAFRTLGRSGADSGGDIVRISEDQWRLEGCPDDGPAMVKDRSGRIHVVWPTLVGGPDTSKGIFYASTADRRAFSTRERLDDGAARTAAHPQIAAVGADGLAVLWDEPAGGSRRVMLRERLDPARAWSAAAPLPDDAPAYYPAAAAVPDALLVVWTSATTPRSSIVVYRKMLGVR